jgi:hypothetical protein
VSRGPLPNPQARRRNAPTVQSSTLPAEGRRGRPPKCPYPLAKPGREWWKWAWALPQATKWDKGALYAVARRGQLEDELAILDSFDPFELGDFLGMDPTDALQQLGFVIGQLKSLAGGRLALCKEMRELDKRLGLDPKALAELRWHIEDEDDAKGRSRPATPDNVRRLRAVDVAAG